MLKKSMLMILFITLVLSVFACGKSISSTTLPKITTTSSTTNTTDERPLLVDAQYDDLVASLPTEFSADIVLPALTDESYEVSYYLNDLVLSNNELNYTPQGFDETIELEVVITFENYSKTFLYEILMLRY